MVFDKRIERDLEGLLKDVGLDDELIESIKRGLKEIKEGETVDFDELMKT